MCCSTMWMIYADDAAANGDDDHFADAMRNEVAKKEDDVDNIRCEDNILMPREICTLKLNCLQLNAFCGNH